MGIKDFVKKRIDKQVEKGNAERNYASNVQNLSMPFDRQLNLNPDNRELEWLDAVLLYEEEYASLRYKHGWKEVKGWEFRRESNRFLPVRWQVGDVVVEARYLSVDGLHVGIVQEKIIKR